MNPQCYCIGRNYKKDCAYTFEQGGSKFHCLGGDLQAIPCDDDAKSIDSWEEEDTNTGYHGILDMKGSDMNLKSLSGGNHPDELEFLPPPPPPPPMEFGITQIEREIKHDPRLFPKPNPLFNGKASKRNHRQFKNADELQTDQRATLNKFESLKINGQSLNAYEIGGYKIDMNLTAKTIEKISPIPPSALPKIFIDDNLNLYHHFFGGVEVLLGSGLFQMIVNSEIHNERDDMELPSKIGQLLKSGLVPGDNAVALLVKKVLSSTFQVTDSNTKHGRIPELTVIANLWGFRYIEPGMVLHDAEVRMWLSVCYSHYRTLWFDTFKSSGVPTFATGGVIKMKNYNIEKGRPNDDYQYTGHRESSVKKSSVMEGRVKRKSSGYKEGNRMALTKRIGF